MSSARDHLPSLAEISAEGEPGEAGEACCRANCTTMSSLQSDQSINQLISSFKVQNHSGNGPDTLNREDQMQLKDFKNNKTEMENINSSV